MAQSTGSYDERLLKDAPVATKEQIQEGYNPELLAPSPRSKSIVHRSQQPSPKDAAPPVPVPLRTDSDIEQGGQSVSHNGSHAYERKAINEKTLSSGKVPFWRTTKGMIIIAVLALVIIAAIIGGAVGGTRKKAKPKAANASSSSDGQGTGGDGIAKAGGSSSSSSSSSTTTASNFIPPGLASISLASATTVATAAVGEATGTTPAKPVNNINQQQTGLDPVLQVEPRRDLGEPLGNILL